jgi:phosphatidylinositol alpha-1,6-mannosyltransferase
MIEKVVITLEAPPRVGGVATYIGNSVAAAKKMGLPIALAAPAGSANVNIPLPCDHSQSFFNLLKAGAAFKKIKASCVYLAEAAAIRAAISWAGWSWTKRQRIRLILHGSEILDLKNSSRFRALLKKAETIYTLSRAVAEMVCKLEPSAKNKFIITGGAPSPTLTAIDGLHDPKKLITVGRLHPRKGQHVILEAMAEGRLPGFSYEIVGPARNKIYARKLFSFARKNKLKVKFYGEIDDTRLSLLYAQSSIFVLPAETLKNRIEGYGLALLDAAAMGLIVVAYDCGGISEAVQHCRTGILIPPGDRAALVDAILQISGNDALAWEMSQAARVWAGGKRWEAVAQGLFL